MASSGMIRRVVLLRTDVTLTIESIGFTEKSAFTRATSRNIPADGILPHYNVLLSPVSCFFHTCSNITVSPLTPPPPLCHICSFNDSKILINKQRNSVALSPQTNSTD
jgi:hypothetical protein